MSQGPGKLESAIESLMQSEPDGAWTVEDLCERIYPGLNRVEKKHRVSALRALKKVLNRSADWFLLAAEITGGTLVLYNNANVRSYALGRLKGDSLNHYRDRRSGVPKHWVKSEAGLLAMIEPGGEDHHRVAEGGAWDLHVQIYLAERDGDTKKAGTLQEDLDKCIQKSLARVAGFVG